MAILLSGALFDRGSGLVATGLSAVLAIYFLLPPYGELAIKDERHFIALVSFAVIGTVMSFIIEALHRAIADLTLAQTELRRSERARGLLLREYRHRTRNDLGSLAALLLLRARAAPSDAAREGLREAADHARALARVHAHLTPEDESGGDGEASVDTREFIFGLCADLEVVQFGEGLRPVALVAEAEAHSLETERAVPLGLVLNEVVTNSLKYAFPEDRPGTVRACFTRAGKEFVLTVIDDGIGLPREEDMTGMRPPRGSGLGTRLLGALAAQLRGSFVRRASEGGTGTVAELRFPVEAPGLRSLSSASRSGSD
jgi:two-component sensor histidine kinase